MTRVALAFCAVCLCAAALISTATFPVLAYAGGDDDFPDGPGKDLTLRVCTTCHDANLIPQLHHTRPEWKAIVTSMVSNGADATAAEVEVIVDYLAKNFK